MKVSYQWLHEWVPDAPDAGRAAELLTLSGVEVDAVMPVAPSDLEGVIVAEITAVEPHPDADRLSVCQADSGQGRHTIVCGAPNARKGLKAPLAMPGAVLPDGTRIKAAKLRGVASEGMLCSAPELGLGEDRSGLMELPADARTGQSLAECLQLDDQVLDIDLTPNRADCLSVRGLARELAAITGATVRQPEMTEVAAAGERSLPIELQSPADCPRYIGRVIEAIDPTAPTPLWMIERLRRSGIRSLGPVVDATNYVLLELGQPLHAFDVDVIDGGIRVRRARPGDCITLLDGQEIEPDEDMLLIADHERPLALAGIMGGSSSAVGDGTRDILLESAWFNPATISGRARRLGLATDSSHRFERGVDPTLQRLAVERATALIVAIAGGRPGPVIEKRDDAYLPGTRAVGLRLAHLNRVLGTELAADEVEHILRRLDMQVESGDEGFTVVAPGARQDIMIEADLIEEVARIHGYDALPSRRPGGRLQVSVPGETELSDEMLRQQLAARGFQEVLGWSFVSRQALETLGLAESAQPLANPLNRDMALLRTSLLPGLLEIAATNLRRQQHDFCLFELGHCFARGESAPVEDARLGLLMAGHRRREHFSARPRALDFYDLKGEVEHLLERNQTPGTVRFDVGSHPWLHPGQSAELLLDDQPAGWLGQLHPAVVDRLELDETIWVAELDQELIGRRRLPGHVRQGRFPALRRDLAVVVADRYSAGEIVAEIRSIAGNLLEKCIIFDQYRGEGIESGCRSLAMGLILRDVSRTLTDPEVDALIENIVTGLKRKFDAQLRG